MNIAYQGCTEKVVWEDVQNLSHKVNPEFTDIINELAPDKKHWLLKVSYPYGSSVMQRSILTLPNAKGILVPITDPSISREIQEGIGYNLNSNPVSLVLKNSFEIFLPLEDRTIPLSGVIEPGTTFGAWRVLSPETTEQPVFIWEMTAGSRSVFMLPKITEELKHKKLEKKLGVRVGSPRTLMQHFDVFKAIANNQAVDEDTRWSAEILYFSKEWFQHLEDPKWSKFYQYFYRSGWAANEIWRNQPLWNLVFSLVLKDYEAKPNAYIMDTAKYLLNMGVGALYGFGPATNTVAGPFDLIQMVYKEIYDIKNYPPIIMQPKLFDFKKESANPVYYSLQFPNSLEFKPSSRMRTSIISDLHEIRSLMLRYERDLLSDKFNLGGTSFSELFLKAKLDYFHSGVDLHEGMIDSANMAEDVNLRKTLDGIIHEEFPGSCLFGKGCIRLSSK
jgi:hypothetical protein